MRDGPRHGLRKPRQSLHEPENASLERQQRGPPCHLRDDPTERDGISKLDEVGMSGKDGRG